MSGFVISGSEGGRFKGSSDLVFMSSCTPQSRGGRSAVLTQTTHTPACELRAEWNT